MFLAELLIISAFAQPSIYPNDHNWDLFFKDDFNTLNTSVWDVENNFDHYGNDTAVYRTQNVYIEDSILIIEIKKEPYCCDSNFVNPYNCAGQWLTGECYQYTSGYMRTKRKEDCFKFGYVESKIRLPAGKGFTPAFWLHRSGEYPHQNTAEIDIFEMDGAKTTTMGTNLYMYYCDDSLCKIYECSCKNKPLYAQKCPDVNPDILCYGQDVTIPDYTTWHTYAVEWDVNKIIWYVDGKVVRNFPNPGIVDYENIILNFGLPKWLRPDESTPFPSKMEVDYVKVYQLKYDCGTAVVGIPDFSLFDYKVKKSITLNSPMSWSGRITKNLSTTLRATDFIELQGGFEVPLGVELYLDINPCNNTFVVGPGGGMSTDGE